MPAVALLVAATRVRADEESYRQTSSDAGHKRTILFTLRSKTGAANGARGDAMGAWGECSRPHTGDAG